MLSSTERVTAFRANTAQDDEGLIKCDGFVVFISARSVGAEIVYCAGYAILIESIR